MIRQKSPGHVQQWVNTLPPDEIIPTAKSHRCLLVRDVSLQSDDASSHCSSVESVLEFRRADPEAVLFGLGFGSSHSTNTVPQQRIPQRFLQPSKLLTSVDLEKFLEQQGESYSKQDCSAPTSPAHFRSSSC